MSKIKREQLVRNLKEIGLKKGDIAFVRADLGTIGRTEKPLKNIILDIFFEVLGSEGTLVSLSFTKQFPIFKVDPNYIFDKTTKSISGSLPTMMINHPSAVRSTHPTSSIVAIGKEAKYLTSEHTENSMCYDYMEKLIDLDAKMILIGCIDSSPGFTTVHFSQQQLGLTKKNILSRLVSVRYKKNNETHTFIRNDIGGCSYGFKKFYAEYEKISLLNKAYIGNAASMLISAKDAFGIDYKLVDENNKYFLCDNEQCFLCRASWKFNKLDWLPFYCKFVAKKAISILNLKITK